jgi:hypothetical protein
MSVRVPLPCDMAAELKANGLSLALVSSEFLEANNTVVKATIMARTPGRGGHEEGSVAHLPLAQAFKVHCHIACETPSWVCGPSQRSRKQSDCRHTGLNQHCDGVVFACRATYSYAFYRLATAG